jgi:hypothetical protein
MSSEATLIESPVSLVTTFGEVTSPEALTYASKRRGRFSRPLLQMTPGCLGEGEAGVTAGVLMGDARRRWHLFADVQQLREQTGMLFAPRRRLRVLTLELRVDSTSGQRRIHGRRRAVFSPLRIAAVDTLRAADELVDSRRQALPAVGAPWVRTKPKCVARSDRSSSSACLRIAEPY